MAAIENTTNHIGLGELAKYIDKFPEFRHKGEFENDVDRTTYEISGTDEVNTPIVVLHGGPGFSTISSPSYRELTTLAVDGQMKSARPVVLYDQYGCGKSPAPENSDLSFCSVDFFVEELHLLLKELKMKHKMDNVVLFGHSWGAGLAIAYMEKYGDVPHDASQVSNVAGLVLASPLISSKDWANDQTEKDDMDQQVLKQRETKIREYILILKDHSKNPIEESDVLAQAMDEMNGFYTAEDETESNYLLNLIACIHGTDLGVYARMWGLSETSADGSSVLADFDVTSVLPSLNVPVLMTTGENDSAKPETVERFLEKVGSKKKEFYFFKNGGHMVHRTPIYIERLHAWLSSEVDHL